MWPEDDHLNEVRVLVCTKPTCLHRIYPTIPNGTEIRKYVTSVTRYSPLKRAISACCVPPANEPYDSSRIEHPTNTAVSIIRDGQEIFSTSEPYSIFHNFAQNLVWNNKLHKKIKVLASGTYTKRDSL
jgi:hypothetical protein